MTSAFTKFIKNKVTHGQAVDTKDDGWKSYLDKDSKRLYNILSAVKCASLLVIGAAILTSAPLLVTAAGACAVYYGTAAVSQAIGRTHVEEEMKDPQNWYMKRTKPAQLLKNIARYAVQPF